MHSVLRRILPARVVKGGEFFRQAVPQWGKVSFQRQKERSRPISRVLSRAIIHLGSASPRTSSSLPGNSAGHAYGSPIWPCSGWGLPCRFRCRLRGALLPHRFTLTCAPPKWAIGGLFSVALAVGSRRPGVTWHPALWSPDFPPHVKRAAIAWPTPARMVPETGKKP